MGLVCERLVFRAYTLLRKCGRVAILILNAKNIFNFRMSFSKGTIDLIVVWSNIVIKFTFQR